MRSVSLLVYKAVDGAIEVGAALCRHGRFAVASCLVLRDMSTQRECINTSTYLVHSCIVC